MKTLHLSIIAIVGIIIIVMTSVGVFMKKLDDNTEPLDTGVLITGVKENYTLNEPITFSVMIDGYGSGCGDTKAILTKENDSQYKSQVWSGERQCASSANPTNFKFNGLSANTTINQVGNYTITASFDDSVTYRHTISEEKFSVTGHSQSPQITTVIIQSGASDPSSGKNYEPQYLHVVIGVNNTVKWINDDIEMNSIVADNQIDPDFFNTTNNYQMYPHTNSKFPNFLKQGESFEYTFTKVGYFGYHGVPHPWMRGWVTVLSQNDTTIKPQNTTEQFTRGSQVNLTNFSVLTCGGSSYVATFVDTGGFANITRANEPEKGSPSSWTNFFDFVLKPNSTGYIDMSFEFGGENYNIGNTSFSGTTQSSLWILNHNTISDLFNKTAIYTLDEPYTSPHMDNLNGISIFTINIDNVTNHTLRLTYVIKIDPSAKEGTYGLHIPYTCPIELLTVGEKPYTGSIPWHRGTY